MAGENLCPFFMIYDHNPRQYIRGWATGMRAQKYLASRQTERYQTIKRCFCMSAHKKAILPKRAHRQGYRTDIDKNLLTNNKYVLIYGYI